RRSDRSHRRRHHQQGTTARGEQTAGRTSMTAITRLSQIPWTKVAAGIVAAFLFFVVVKTVRAGAQTMPNAQDARYAERHLCGGGAVASGTTPARIGGNGVVEPAGRESRLASRAQGVVTAIRVKEGDHVEEGAVLIELESSAERAAVVSAEADVALSTAEL